MWAELEDTKKKLIDAEKIIKIWKEKYRILNRYFSKTTLGGETSIWKNSYKKLFEIRIRTPLIKNKIKIANKIERLIKIC
jgi:hypothetical protein